MPHLDNLLFSFLIYIGSFFAGLLGSLTGLGGGVVVVPMGIDFRLTLPLTILKSLEYR